jgi:hypothetical protein
VVFEHVCGGRKGHRGKGVNVERGLGVTLWIFGRARKRAHRRRVAAQLVKRGRAQERRASHALHVQKRLGRPPLKQRDAR